MTLQFQIRREDVLALSCEYNAASPTYQKARARVRLMLPVMMVCLWIFVFASRGFDWPSAIVFPTLGALWFFFYPARYERQVQRYMEQTIDEKSYSKSLGPCELRLEESGLHSKSNTGESTYYWSSVERVVLKDAYLFIFIAGQKGYPIAFADVGEEVAKAAYEYALGMTAR